MKYLTCCAVVLFPFLGSVVSAQEVDYRTQIKPLLSAKCYSCHGALKQQAGLRLETRSLMLKGGESGPALKAKDAKASLIYQRLTASDDERMPPADEGARLSKAELKLIRQWITEGAKAPVEPIPIDPRKHWSFLKPTRPALPQVVDNAWASNPIDRFVAVQHARRKLQPQRLASRRVRLRRLYVDLIGIPPTREQLHRFLDDSSPDAYIKVVRQLLADKAYGERWGRHWMDVWRYTDWYGLGAQVRYSQKHIWRWRDWIIESLNADKPYSRMVLEMLAGDEIAPADPEIVRATGFLARNYFLFNRTTWLNGTVEHTSKSLLGLTLNCARCHDHKYDPLQQRDFYRMRAIFEPHQVRLDPVPGETDLNRDGLPRAFDNNPQTPTFLFIRGDEKRPDKANPVGPGVPVMFGAKFQPRSVALPPAAFAPRVQPFVLQDHLSKASGELKSAEAAVKRAKRVLASAKPSSKSKSARKRGAVVFRDDFDKQDSTMWIQGPGDWKIAGGKLVQSRYDTELKRLYYRSQAKHPTDFEVNLKLTLSGQGGLRSVGIGFDSISRRDKLVYVSGGGGKVQLAYGTSPGYAYPATAKFNQPFKSKTPYLLTVRVRGQLVNVAINGVHRFAYVLPVKREAGHLDLVAYDGSVAFDFVEVRKLPVTYPLIGAQKGKVTPAVARLALDAATKRLVVAQLHAQAIQSAHRADRAKAKLDGVKDAGSFIRSAAVAFAKYQLAQIEANVATQRHLIAVNSGAKKAAAQKALAAATRQLAKARKTVARPGTKYLALRTTLRAANGMTDEATPRQGPYSPTSTGRRTALAKWIIDRNNPLTARVAVNHIWLRHFGQPLVASMTDFGLRTKRPQHHALLDWLAIELMEGGWKMKRIHELIVTSRAYQLESSLLNADPATLRADRDNHFYWRRKPVRMESQVVRDAMLQIAGVMDRKMGGPTVDPAQEHTSYRRSMYFTHSRDDRSKFIAMFDDADILHCYRRKASIMPQQALALSNSKLAIKMSRLIAARLKKKHGKQTDRQFVETAFETMLLERPTSDEIDVCLDALKQTRALLQQQKNKSADERARENLVHALLNHNDFITVR